MEKRNHIGIEVSKYVRNKISLLPTDDICEVHLNKKTDKIRLQYRQMSSESHFKRKTTDIYLSRNITLRPFTKITSQNTSGDVQ